MASSALRTARRTPGRPARTLRREFVTPEGIDLRLRLGSAGDRAGAFLLDGFIILLVLIALTIAAAWLGLSAAVEEQTGGMTVIAVVWLLAFFGLRMGWFIGWELRPRAATPGKRVVGLRVVARDGGRLTAGAVVARNALRELEVFVPLYFAFASLDENGWVAATGFVWAGVFLFLPLFNRDRLRAGDLLAGTWVVRVPKVELGGDLGVAEDRVALWRFTDEQLDHYGEAEFQQLAAVLRSPTGATAADVAHTIGARIGVTVRHLDTADFLTAYHAALGERLERRALFGRRKSSKRDVLTFRPSQLAIYGQAQRLALDRALLDPGSHSIGPVAAAIRRRIGWDGPEVDDRTFLESYRSALDSHIGADAPRSESPA